MNLEQINFLIRDVPDFPKPGIVFKDIAPLLAAPGGIAAVTTHLAEAVRGLGGAPIDGIVAIEARGFIFGAPLSERLGIGLELVRKKGKLPFKTVSRTYDLEYGTDTVEMHVDAVQSGKRYLVVDDLIATGGTALAACELLEHQGGVVAACAFVIELSFLPGLEKLGDRPVIKLLSY